uniref:Mitochondrial inner membrane protease ATP23 n=1 Tax=Timema cristinae TaxID=61476 RepID=A0A7R9CE02_TIMCR|nr:unnamed protein product [Timema cristinae]
MSQEKYAENVEDGTLPKVETEKDVKDESVKWGYDLYPERRGENYKPSPLVKLMMNALKSSGCEIDIRRHISCEVCDVSVSGGYDPIFNQIVVCQNVARKEGYIQGVLAHEMIHMFDYCRNDLDFKNIDHLACTEIRAANLTHCSFLSACTQGDASPINIRQKHQECVKTKATRSVFAVRNVTPEEARAAVERVFPKCYADLEPVGRRIRRNSNDMHRAYFEGPLYGYDS